MHSLSDLHYIQSFASDSLTPRTQHVLSGGRSQWISQMMKLFKLEFNNKIKTINPSRVCSWAEEFSRDEIENSSFSLFFLLKDIKMNYNRFINDFVNNVTPRSHSAWEHAVYAVYCLRLYELTQKPWEKSSDWFRKHGWRNKIQQCRSLSLACGGRKDGFCIVFLFNVNRHYTVYIALHCF